MSISSLPARFAGVGLTALLAAAYPVLAFASPDSVFWRGDAQAAAPPEPSTPPQPIDDGNSAAPQPAPVTVVNFAIPPPMTQAEFAAAVRAAVAPAVVKPGVVAPVPFDEALARAKAAASPLPPPSPLVMPGSAATMPRTEASTNLPRASQATGTERPTPNATGAGISPSNYGAVSFNSGYMYSDRRARTATDIAADPFEPEGRIGLLTVDMPSAPRFRCTAALIAPSIIVTAGHCVNSGGPGGVYLSSATFAPAYSAGVAPHGIYPVINGAVAWGWLAVNLFNHGNDVAVLGLGYRPGTTNTAGAYAGTLGFCYGYCLQNLWGFSNYGYAANYGIPATPPALGVVNRGEYLFEGNALGLSNGLDYTFGSGMWQMGSDGGPLITNPGTLADFSPKPGEYSARNIIHAVRSWSYDSEPTFKISGASALSGTGVDNNNFKAMYNAVCAQVRAAQTVDSCALIP